MFHANLTVCFFGNKLNDQTLILQVALCLHNRQQSTHTLIFLILQYLT